MTGWEDLEKELEGCAPEVLRLFSLSLIKEVGKLRTRNAFLEKQEAQEAQTKLQLKEQLTTLKKLIFNRGQEKRKKNRRRQTEREKLLLFAASLTPPLEDKVESKLEIEKQTHEVVPESLQEIAALYGYPKDSEWEVLTGLEEKSQEITMVERRYVKILHERAKYRLKASKNSEKEIIITAPGPAKLFPGSRYSIDFALAVVTDKYLQHLPLERQRRAMEEAGLEGISVKTLYALCQGVAVHMESVILQIKKDIFSVPLAVHCDETPWPILCEKDDDGYLWCISNQAGSIFQFEPTRSGKVIEEMLRGYDGPVVHDRYAGYNRLKQMKGISVAACWAHARRKFFEIEELYPKECGEILDLIDELFEVEHKASTWDQLKLLREKESTPIVDKIRDWLFKHKPKQLPQSKFTQAITYMLKGWDEFRAFLNDIRIPLSNNDVERALRHGVLGRKNFYGSKTINGADVMATLYSVIETCKKAELIPRDYMKYVILRNIAGKMPLSPLEHARQIRAPKAAAA